MSIRAIILAAGAGTRLNPMTNGRPKCLVPFGELALIDHQMRALSNVGVEDFIFVVGYEADQIRRHCRGREARFVDNPDYASTNSIFSLYLARHFLTCETFLLNCDIVFHPDVVGRLLACGHPNAIAVDGHAERIAGEMNVWIQPEGRVGEVSKQLAPAQSQAQSVQVVKFDAAGARSVAAEVERLVGEDRKDAFPTSSYGQLITRGELFAVETGDLPWAEIDCVDDYRQAIANVLPRL